jgi:hypothetical protein
MVTVRGSGEYRIQIDDATSFLRDAVSLRIIERVQGGYVPLTLKLERGDLVPEGSSVEIEPTDISNDLVDGLLIAFANFRLGTDSNLVETIRRLRREKERVTQQLESLIAGIGRMGGQ